MSDPTGGCSTETCGGCEGTQKLTPALIANRPGLSALRYRVGTHGSFLETMKARLSAMTVEAPGPDGQTMAIYKPLRGHTTRESGDPAIALLDAWATVGDVLTFYQERLANEGYLRTATERRSVLELARLVGYTLRPGVAASVFLAYTLEDKQVGPVEIPAGARSQSIPGPGEMPQSFETSEKLIARSEWNNLPVRRARPQNITYDTAKSVDKIYVAGINANLKAGDQLLFKFDDEDNFVPRTVMKAEGQFTMNRTEIQLQPMPSPDIKAASKALTTNGLKFFEEFIKTPIPQKARSLQLKRILNDAFAKGADTCRQLRFSFEPQLRDIYYAARANATVKTDALPALKAVYALRIAAPLFGAGAPDQPDYYTDDKPDDNPPHFKGQLKPQEEWRDWELQEDKLTLFLDRAYEAVLPGSYVMIQLPAGERRFLKITEVQTTQRMAYGFSGKTTQLKFSESWWPKTGKKFSMDTLRGTLVYGQGEELTLVDEPIEDEVKVTNDSMDAGIELAGIYGELASGRWIILSGERTDIFDENKVAVSGIRGSELLMISGVRHGYDKSRPGDKIHTTLLLATPTAYSYKRDTLTIYGNVVKATQGETRKEVLGSGDGSQAFQGFALKQPPLTFVAAPTPSGVDSTLEVRVNDVEWHEAETLAGLGPKDRRFVTKTDDEAKITVIFGNGQQGARLPTGMENVKAVYRNGIGKAGNVRAEQISLLLTRPLGVKSVINPLRASGGADKESRDQARQNAPLAVMALDRLVSVRDYADFARTFAGIAKADARRLSDGRRELVHLTIAGVDDVPIDAASDLYINLRAALRKFGDPMLPVQVDLRELKALVLSANIRLDADYRWETVAPAIRAALLDAFSFEKRALGQPVFLSEVISVVQSIPGVAYVDVDAFGGIAEKKADEATGERRLLTLDELAPEKPAQVDIAPRVDVNLAAFENGAVRPAQLAIFSAAVPDTLILNEKE